MAALFFLTDCEKEPEIPDNPPGDPDPDPSPTAWITSLGGAINWKDLQLTIPADCLTRVFKLPRQNSIVPIILMKTLHRPFTALKMLR
ncbi:MAG: hypothetical protein CVT92_12740 [Bacteroidetes bacterium HGW-Bacteroidetes-1]|nr:MAG: hypothetical protein CVT92_12740 [Bacteroidetes bacterium HGW-Bacteroidetes-1]